MNLSLALKLATAALICFFAAALCSAQDIPIGVTYICSGEHIYVENCNIRDTSDNANCMVAHPDHLTATGMNTYTYMTRGALKKLLPTCQQPSAKQVADAKARQKKAEDTYKAEVAKANTSTVQVSPAPSPQPAGGGESSGPEERAMRRCISAGRLPSTCTGNSLLGVFSQMVSAAAPGLLKESQTGPNMAGVFQGAGNWRLDFIDEGVLVNCAGLSPNQTEYKIEFRSDRTVLVLETTPKPLEMTIKPDGTIVGPGPVTINGVVASGYSGPDPSTTYSGYHDSNGVAISDQQAASSAGPVYDALGNRVYGAVQTNGAGHATFSAQTATCPAQNLSSKGAGVGIQTMQTDVLKMAFGGDKGPPTPPGIRMHGIYAASSGFSVQFFPESAILGCGPDAARAYPYTVTASGANALIKIDSPDHPLTLTLKPDGTIDPGGTGAYQVHGRRITGQNDEGDFTFAPMEQSCDLAVLSVSKAIPASGGRSATAEMAAKAATTLSTAEAPTGRAILAVVSGLPAQPGAANPLAGHPFVLLRDTFATALRKGGVTIPAGTSAYRFAGTACANKTPDCQKVNDAIKADAASAVRADANGNGTFPGVPPGMYFLMISAQYNNRSLMWIQMVQLNDGANSIKLEEHNAMPLN